ncbi:MAG TPA: hypothetical protein VLA15_03460, partial [Desulfurivibrionaceae bacterium]|nr:hypothetical protein [Desulfurivibrionaceae bacterium]
PTKISPIACLSEAWETVKPRYWLLLGINLVASLIYGAVFLLVGPMLVGIFHCMDLLKREEPVEFSDAFSGFNGPSIGALILYSLLYSLLIGAISMIGYIIYLVGFFSFGMAGASGANPEASAAMAVSWMFGGMCCYGGGIAFFSFVAMYWLNFAGMLAFDRNAPLGDAMILGFVLVGKNFWQLLVLSLLTSLLSLAGVFACFVGVIFVMPVIMAAPWAAYRTWFPDDQPADTFAPALPAETDQA